MAEKRKSAYGVSADEVNRMADSAAGGDVKHDLYGAVHPDHNPEANPKGVAGESSGRAKGLARKGK